MSDTEFYHVVLIDAPRERVWEALTNGAFTKQYWHETEVQSDWNIGSPVDFFVEREGTRMSACTGEVLEADHPAKLSYSWHFPLNPECAEETPSRVTFILEVVGDATKLIVRHDRFESAASTTFQMVRDGWPFVLGGLKTLCETGRTRDFSMLEAG